MAMRRSPDGMNEYGGFQQDGNDDMSGLLQSLLGQGPVKEPTLDEGVNMTGLMKEPTSDEGTNMTGNGLPMQGAPGEGNTTTGREMFDRRPTMPGLPQGMTVQGEDQGNDGGQSAFSTPMMPHEPTPVSGGYDMSMAPQNTRRVSSPGAESALFSDASGGTPMFGRAGGLMGGGVGVQGSNEGGPTPTDMMLSLLRMFRSGG